jgi:hypothetical protein
MSWPSSQPIEDISKASDDSLSWAYNKGVKSIATVVRTLTVSMAQYEVIFFHEIASRRYSHPRNQEDNSFSQIIKS